LVIQYNPYLLFVYSKSFFFLTNRLFAQLMNCFVKHCFVKSAVKFQNKQPQTIYLSNKDLPCALFLLCF